LCRTMDYPGRIAPLLLHSNFPCEAVMICKAMHVYDGCTICHAAGASPLTLSFWKQVVSRGDLTAMRELDCPLQGRSEPVVNIVRAASAVAKYQTPAERHQCALRTEVAVQDAIDRGAVLSPAVADACRSEALFLMCRRLHVLPTPRILLCADVVNDDHAFRLAINSINFRDALKWCAEPMKCVRYAISFANSPETAINRVKSFLNSSFVGHIDLYFTIALFTNRFGIKQAIRLMRALEDYFFRKLLKFPFGHISPSHVRAHIAMTGGNALDEAVRQGDVVCTSFHRTRMIQSDNFEIDLYHSWDAAPIPEQVDADTVVEAVRNALSHPSQIGARSILLRLILYNRFDLLQRIAAQIHSENLLLLFYFVHVSRKLDLEPTPYQILIAYRARNHIVVQNMLNQAVSPLQRSRRYSELRSSSSHASLTMSCGLHQVDLDLLVDVLRTADTDEYVLFYFGDMFMVFVDAILRDDDCSDAHARLPEICTLLRSKCSHDQLSFVINRAIRESATHGGTRLVCAVADVCVKYGLEEELWAALESSHRNCSSRICSMFTLWVSAVDCIGRPQWLMLHHWMDGPHAQYNLCRVQHALTNPVAVANAITKHFSNANDTL